MMNVFEFNHYRPFLQSYFDDQKLKNAALTLSTVARHFGLSAPSLTMILQGKRNLSLKHGHRISDLLKFSPEERDFFECLILKDDAEEENAKSHYDRRIQKYIQAQKTKSLRTADRFLLSRWYIPAMLVYLMDRVKTQSVTEIEELRKSLQSIFGATEEDIGKIVVFLQEADLGQKPEPANLHVIFQRLASQIPEKKFIHEVLEETQKRIDAYGSSDSFFTTAALSIHTDQLSGLRADYKNLIEKYIALGNQPNQSANKIIQMSCQFFSVL